MKAIRGATTVASDTPEEIKSSVAELLINIKEQNGLNDEDIICIMFSNTSDIRSFYPAKAAREAGFFSCALYSTLEPEIDGSLNLCIRVMVLAEINTSPKHIYLKGASGLRKDLTNKINIAIDGPAGSGKSTVSELIAKKFDILYLDTGAMYQACALACVVNGVDCNDAEKVEKLFGSVDISVKYRNGSQSTLLCGEDVSDKIRTPEISMLASAVSAHSYVREKMVELQREIAAENSCVLDGRDIGSNVLPSAPYKFFLTASPEVRAERRTKENLSRGIAQPYEEVLEEIKKRDEQDSSRKTAPLIKASDAIEINTDNMTIENVVDTIINRVQGKI